MQALFIHHDQYSGADIVGERLLERGWQIVDHYVAVIEDPYSERPFPEISGFDLIASAGAIWSVYDEEAIGSWIGRELDVIRSAHESGTPILGICFGSQALAKALGGDVFRAKNLEVGWYWLESRIPDAIAPGPWFQWHEDSFTLPEGAMELARNDNGTQAFRVGRSFAVQFHPEVTAQRIEQWIDVGGYRVLEELEIDREELVIESRASEEVARANAHRLVDWFLDEVAFPGSGAVLRGG